MIKSILAGVLISIGCCVNLSCDNKYIGAFLFSLGLYSIIIFGLNLYTGKVGYLSSQTKKWKYVDELFKIWIGNFIGCFISALCIVNTRLGINSDHLIAIKQNDTYVSLFVLSIFCGMLMYIAVEGYKRTKNPLIVVLPVMVFILSGFEHVIADQFYWFVSKNMEIKDFLISMIVMTLGNGIGGNVVNLASGDSNVR